ncbi:Aste57867_566 [Aphanomyces stellatus]|uniref:Aste57867_566 protein n=1 Tax=Aphanomyces stellatus TaxID=120398 RepID=A0A485K3Y3_9STRA|nr:hypothetical protein As57867_000565 [Aphanomyces stellatus]VFT77791.1 Aste57867_566 [Aphanomyces stellatus]
MMAASAAAPSCSAGHTKYAFFSCAAGIVAVASACEKASFASADDVLQHLLTSKWSLLVLLNVYVLGLAGVFHGVVQCTVGAVPSVEMKHVREAAFHFVLLRCILLFNVVDVSDGGDRRLLPLVVWLSLLALIHAILTTFRQRLNDLSSPAPMRYALLALGGAVAAIAHASLHVFSFPTSLVVLSECALLGLTWLQVCAHLVLADDDTIDDDDDDDSHAETKASAAAQIHMILDVLSLAATVAQYVWMRVVVGGRADDETWRISFLDFVLVVHAKQTYTAVRRQFVQWRHRHRILGALDDTFLTVHGVHDRCVVCLHAMDTAKQLACGHSFHRRCLRQCLEEHHKQCTNDDDSIVVAPWKCAVCRQDVPLVVDRSKNKPAMTSRPSSNEGALWPLAN